MSINPSDVRIAVLAGGISQERTVSLSSGQASAEALRAADFQVTLLDPARKEDLVALIQGHFDAAFLCLHGRGGEDGTIQGFLETINLPYTGSRVAASATAINKVKTKEVYRANGIPTAKSTVLYKPAFENLSSDELNAIWQEFAPKCVVKPATEGSTIGISLVDSFEDLGKALAEAFSFDSEVLIESFFAGREFTVSVLDKEEGGCQALPVIEIIPKEGFYNYEAKYAVGGSTHLCPAPLSDEITRKLQALAEKAHTCLGCSDVSRTDFLVNEAGEACALETNTIPGMTATSLLPDAARVAGYSFPELCTYLVRLALRKR